MRTLMPVVCLLIAAIAAAEPIAFTNVNVVTMTEERARRDQVVIVDSGRIVAVGPKDTVAIPANATRIDGENGFLMPGLIDMHAHLEHGGVPLFVANGVTTIALLGDGLPGLELRERAAAGELAPGVVACAEYIVDVKTPASAERMLDDTKADGYDCIKIYDDVSVETLNALTAGARTRGLLSIGHIPRNLRWQDMLAAKPDAIAHLEELLYSPVEDGDDNIIVGMMAKNGISMITTLVTYDYIGRQVADLEAMLDRGDLRWVSPIRLRMWDATRNRYRTFKKTSVPNLRRLLGFQKTMAKALHEGGVPVLMGTDAGGPPFITPGFTAPEEVRILVTAGLKPYDALRAATVSAARFLERDDLGTIEPGKVADLVLLRGDPLRDVENLQLRAGVMLRGRWLDQVALRGILENERKTNAVEAELLRVLETKGDDAAIAFARAHRDVPEADLLELAYQFLRADKNQAKALTWFRAVVQLHPRSWMAHHGLGDGLFESGQRDAAMASYRKSAGLNPKNRSALAKLNGAGSP